MRVLQPIVYTRPFRRNVMDYCYFVLPEILKGSGQLKNVDRHLRNVLAVECGRGDIRGNRWHFFRFADYVLIGIATESFGHRDETGVAIRGYYGLLMSAEEVHIPTISCFSYLDDEFVKPHFNDYKNFEICYSQNLQVRDEFWAEINNEEKCDIKFNFDSGKVKFLSENIPAACYLCRAIEDAKRGNNFEFVFGLNTEEHACEIPVMNVVCYGTSPKLVSLQHREVHSPMDCREGKRGAFISSSQRMNEKRASAEDVKRRASLKKSMHKEATSHGRRMFGIEYAEEEEGILTNIIQGVIHALVRIDALINHRKIKIYKKNSEDANMGHAKYASTPTSTTGTKKTPNYTFGMTVDS